MRKVADDAFIVSGIVTNVEEIPLVSKPDPEKKITKNNQLISDEIDDWEEYEALVARNEDWEEYEALVAENFSDLTTIEITVKETNGNKVTVWIENEDEPNYKDKEFWTNDSQSKTGEFGNYLRENYKQVIYVILRCDSNLQLNKILLVKHTKLNKTGSYWFNSDLN